MLDRFGLVLMLILVILFVTALQSASEAWSVVLLVLQGTTLAAALAASGTPRWMRLAAVVVTLLGVAGTVAGSIWGGTEIAVAVGDVLVAVLAGMAPIAIGWRLLKHDHVSGHTVAGALCIYLLIGLFFSVAYSLSSALLPHAALVGRLNGGPVDYLYFSFITMATVGYGDITPSSDIVRMLAVVQSLLGQLYLVTVVAMLIGRVRRDPRDPAASQSGSDG